MKVAVLSNSHVVMMKVAHERTPDPRWTPTFFAAPMTRMTELRYDRAGRRLWASPGILRQSMQKTSGGLTEILLDEYDAVALVGLTIKTRSALKLMTEFVPHRFAAAFGKGRVNLLERLVAGEAALGPLLISEAAFAGTLAQEFDGSAAGRLMGHLKEAGIPVVFAPSPLPRRALGQFSKYEWLRSAEGKAAALWATELSRRLWTTLAERRGVRVVEQPERTIDSGLYTREEFATGAENMNKEAYSQGDMGDMDHMNAVYGALVAEGLIGGLLEPRATQSRPQ